MNSQAPRAVRPQLHSTAADATPCSVKAFPSAEEFISALARGELDDADIYTIQPTSQVAKSELNDQHHQQTADDISDLLDTGKKYDAGKPRWNLLPWIGMNEVVKVLTFGAEKYGAYNWEMVPDARARYIAAAMRHICAFEMPGPHRDEETDLHHLAHAICCLLFILQDDMRHNGRD